MKSFFTLSISLKFIKIAALLLVVLSTSFFAFRSHYTVIVGASMTPTYHTGDIVKIEPVTTYKIGDIFVIDSSKEGRIIKRLVHVGPCMIYTYSADGYRHTEFTSPRGDKGFKAAVKKGWDIKKTFIPSGYAWIVGDNWKNDED